MTTMTVPAGDVRVPRDVRDAVDRHDPVTVVAHDRASIVLIHPDDYELVSHMLERRRQGRPVPFHQLLNDDDIAVIVEDQAADGDVSSLAIWETWHA